MLPSGPQQQPCSAKALKENQMHLCRSRATNWTITETFMFICYVPQKAFRYMFFACILSAYLVLNVSCVWFVCEGCLPAWDSVLCWPRAALGDTIYLPCPPVFSLFKNNTGITHNSKRSNEKISVKKTYYLVVLSRFACVWSTNIKI